jgi:hypothetical protein
MHLPEHLRNKQVAVGAEEFDGPRLLLDQPKWLLVLDIGVRGRKIYYFTLLRTLVIAYWNVYGGSSPVDRKEFVENFQTIQGGNLWQIQIKEQAYASDRGPRTGTQRPKKHETGLSELEVAQNSAPMGSSG